MNGLIGYELMTALIYWLQIAVAFLSCKCKTYEKMNEKYVNNSHLIQHKKRDSFQT